jgi:hypothetical protein
MVDGLSQDRGPRRMSTPEMLSGARTYVRQSHISDMDALLGGGRNRPVARNPQRPDVGHRAHCRNVAVGPERRRQRRRRTTAAGVVARVSRTSSVLITVRCPRTPERRRERPRGGDGHCPAGSKARSFRGVAMLSPWFGMTGIGPGLQVWFGGAEGIRTPDLLKSEGRSDASTILDQSWRKPRESVALQRICVCSVRDTTRQHRVVSDQLGVHFR